MGRTWESVFLSGLFILAFVFVILLSNPAPPGPRGAFIDIDTQLQGESSNVKIAKLKMSLNEQRYLDNFPHQINNYQGTDDDKSESLRRNLKADTLLIREYRKAGLSQPIFLVIIHSPKSTSFHPPPNCYRAQKFSIAESIKDTISVRDTSLGKLIDEQTPVTKDRQWHSIGEWLALKLNIQSYPEEIPVNKLIVYKAVNNEVVERRLDLHLYMKDQEFVSHEFTMLEVSALIPAYGRYDDIETELITFMSEVLALIFEDYGENSETVISIIASLGPKGYFVITGLFTIPLAMIIYPLATRKIFSRGRYKKEREPESGTTGKTLYQFEESIDKVGETKTVTKLLSLPFNLEEKTGNDKILGAYYNSQWIIEKATNTSAVSCHSFRDFLDSVLPKLSAKTADQFAELTRMAEVAMYSISEEDKSTVTRACYLADEIIRELYTTSMEH
ncbi:exosortase-associated EpsI family protein [Chloroflexota bacterium]